MTDDQRQLVDIGLWSLVSGLYSIFSFPGLSFPFRGVILLRVM